MAKATQGATNRRRQERTRHAAPTAPRLDPMYEGESEELKERSRWFIGQRIFPARDAIPYDALSRARRHKDTLKKLARMRRDSPAEAFSAAFRWSTSPAAMCMSDTGQRVALRRVKNPSAGNSFGFASSSVEIGSSRRFRSAFLRVPSDTTLVEQHDLDVASLRLFRWDQPRRAFRLVPASAVDMQSRRVYARIVRPGIYTVIGLSANPWVKQTLRAFSALRPWLRASPAIGRPLRQRICQLVLCPQSRLKTLIRESGKLAEMGLAPYPTAGMRNICALCLRSGDTDAATPWDSSLVPETELIDEEQRRSMTWSCVGPRNFNGRIRALAFHPANSDILYAGSSNGGVWVTTNGGLTWDPLMNDVDCPSIGALAAHLGDPLNPLGHVTIYAGTGEPVDRSITYPGIGVLKSEDSGATWTLVGAGTLLTSAGKPPRGIAAIVLDPTDPMIVYVASFDGGLFRSSDGGLHWTRQLDGDFRGLVMDPLDPQTLYAGRSSSGVWATSNGGGSWALLAGVGLPSPGGTVRVVNVAVARTASTQAIYAKFDDTVYRSIDGAQFEDCGDHGQSTNDGWCSHVTVHPANPNIVYAGGISLERDDAFGTPGPWPKKNGTGSTEQHALHADQHALAIDPHNDSRVYAANDGGVYFSDNRGNTWTKRSNGLVVSEFYHIGIGPGAGLPLLGGGAQDVGMLETTAGDPYWASLLTGDGGQYRADPADASIRYYERDRLFISKRVGTVQSGAINGINRTDLLPWIGAIAIEPSTKLVNPGTNRTLYTGTTRIYKTTNGCGQWQPVSNDLGGIVTALAIAPSDSRVVYAGTEKGAIVKTVHGGGTPADWVPCAQPLPARWITWLAVDPGDPMTVYVTFSGFDSGGLLGHVFKSPDGGQTWKRIDDVGIAAPDPERLPDIPVNAIVIDSQYTNVLYVATDVGIFTTADEGDTWEVFDDGLPSCVISSLALDDTGTMLYAGTFGRGAYRRQL